MVRARTIDRIMVISYTQAMKRAVILFLIFLQPVMSYAHPGKTDRYGGHTCLRGCDEWGLFYKEYHLHDKEGRPIRVKSNKAVKESGVGAVVEQVSEPTKTIVQVAKPITEVVTTYRYVTNVYEENVILSHPLIAVLLILLLMLLLLKMNREKDKQ